MFTIILGYRNRDLTRVRRCLDSLDAQTFRDFTIIFVDYGSDTQTAHNARDFIATYNNIVYIYSDTRGYPWNRSHALNIGMRQATTPYVIITDADMIFPPEFLQVVANHASADLTLHCAPHYLPESFDDWEHPERYLQTLQRGDKRQLGGFHCVSTAVLHELHGYDEFYRYWGLEDGDLHRRLQRYGLGVEWLNDETYFFHQWHPPASIHQRGFVPRSFWIHAALYREIERDRLIRNDDDWGQVITSDDRLVFQHIDVESQSLILSDRLHTFDPAQYGLLPSSQEAVGRLLGTFREMNPGEVLVVTDANFPQDTVWTWRLRRYGIRLFERLTGNATYLEPAPNLLHELIAELVYHRDLVADYYLNLETEDGVSVLVRR